jgi:hypothetical protein
MSNYIFPLNVKTNENHAVDFLKNKSWGCDQLYTMKSLIGNRAYLIPTKKSVETYGKSNLDVLIAGNVSVNENPINSKFKRIYSCQNMIRIPYDTFELVWGKLPNMNSGPIKTNK